MNQPAVTEMINVQCQFSVSKSDFSYAVKYFYNSKVEKKALNSVESPFFRGFKQTIGLFLWHKWWLLWFPQNFPSTYNYIMVKTDMRRVWILHFIYQVFILPATSVISSVICSIIRKVHIFCYSLVGNHELPSF